MCAKRKCFDLSQHDRTNEAKKSSGGSADVAHRLAFRDLIPDDQRIQYRSGKESQPFSDALKEL